jgi:hypothetical protein
MTATKHWLFAGAGLISMLGVLGVVQGQPSSSAKASASASAPPPITSSQWMDPLELASATIPTTISDKPKREDWKSAVEVRVRSHGYSAKSCKAELLREWMRVSCYQAMGGIRQFVGSTKDVELFIYAKDIQNLFAEPNGGEIVFPLRKGEPYLFQFFTLSSEYEGFGVSPSVLVDVSWSGSRKQPTVVMR